MTSPTEPADTTPPAEHLSRRDNPSDNVVQRTRAWTGLWVVVAGDVAIAVAAILGIVKTAGTTNTNSPTVAILSSAFTAIGTMTTAYFGIKSISNTAQSYAPPGTTPAHKESSEPHKESSELHKEPSPRPRRFWWF